MEGEPAAEALALALARVVELVPYLGARINPPEMVSAPASPPDRPLPDDDRWLPSQELIDDPDWLGRIIRATGIGIGTDDPVVAASVFVQGYSYRVLTLAVACLTASGVVPDSSAPRMALGLARHWPSRVAYCAPRVMVVDGTDAIGLPADSDAITDALRFVVETAIDSHLDPLIESVRTGIGVPLGRRLLWGNVAASAATAFRTMEGSLGSSVEALGHRFFALAPPPLQGLGSFFVAESGPRRGWFWERTNCCLIDRLPGGVRCADCSLTPTEERRQAYRDSLSTDPEASGGTTPGG
jgi:iron complex transport system ATP-binding protein